MGASSGKSTRRSVILLAAGLLLGGCGTRREKSYAVIEFSRVPQADPGGTDKHEIIEGTVKGGLPPYQIVLYARNGNWWVQPVASQPFTPITKESKWTNATHLGTEYAALLVKPGFQPPATLTALPDRGGLVVAVARVSGSRNPPSPSLYFSGYEWRVRDAPSSRGGRKNPYDPGNAWTDNNGALHLRIAKSSNHQSSNHQSSNHQSSNQWTCAEVSLTRSLGYGTYSFTVRDISPLEPAAVFGMFTWDYAKADQNFGEADIEISKWGDPTNKNAQYTLQPFYLPANVARFTAPAGVLVHSLRWEPGRMSFRTVSRPERGGKPRAIEEHVFLSGIPSPAIESVRMNLYIYGHSRVPMKNGAEVVIEKFEYLP